MARMSGADPEQLEQLGRHMDDAAGRLDAIRAEVTSVVRQAHWEGDDAVYFRDQWQFRLSGLVHTAAAGTREASAALRRNANEQRTASGSDAAAGTGAGGGGSVGAGSYGDPGAVIPWDPMEGLSNLLGRMGAVGDIAAGIGGVAAGLKDTKWLTTVVDNPAWRVGGKVLGRAGEVGAVLDVARFGWALSDGDPQAIKARGADLAFDAVAAGAIAASVAVFPPGVLVVGAAELGWSFVPDHTKAEMVDGVGAAASTVAHVSADIVGGGVRAVESAGGAVADVASGGFNAVKKVFRW